jgi:hypothetical protein
VAHQLYVIEFQNGKKYFGITGQKLSCRWKAHLSTSKRRNSPISRALRNHKDDAAIHLLVIGHRDYILDLEIKAIEAFKTRDPKFGYNSGVGGEISPTLGVKHSLESLTKISEASKKRPRLAESNAKTSATLKGHDVSDETKKRISVGTKEAWKDPEFRERVIAPKRGHPPLAALAAITGKPLTIEHRKNISIGVKGKKRSPEICAMMSSMLWWHRGDESTRSIVCPGNGWVLGRGKVSSAKSGRDAEIIQRHLMGGESQKSLASEFGITQRRVRQIIYAAKNAKDPFDWARKNGMLL